MQRFIAPSCLRCAGTRGLTVATRPGSMVRATLAGEITFAGQVGGVLWVVQQVAPGVRVTYGRLETVAGGIVIGTRIARGTPVGVADTSIYLGVRVGETPADPTRCWTRRIRLVPPDVGRSGRPR